MISTFAIYSWSWKEESIVQGKKKNNNNPEPQTKNILETKD